MAWYSEVMKMNSGEENLGRWLGRRYDYEEEDEEDVGDQPGVMDHGRRTCVGKEAWDGMA